MSKIIKAINVMVSNPDKIGKETRGTSSKEIFFTYMSKHNWSMYLREEKGYALHYYPGDETIEDLASISTWEDVSMITYTSSELGTREAFESMRDLHTILTEKLYGLNKVLDEIIDSDVPF